MMGAGFTIILTKFKTLPREAVFYGGAVGG